MGHIKKIATIILGIIFMNILLIYVHRHINTNYNQKVSVQSVQEKINHICPKGIYQRACLTAHQDPLHA